MLEFKFRYRYKEYNKNIIETQIFYLSELEENSFFDNDEIFSRDIYTGVNDTDDNEIYVSDNIKYCGGPICTIIFNRGSYGFYYQGTFIHLFNSQPSEIQIVGNKYDNLDTEDNNI